MPIKAPRFESFLIKVASRCNLNCSYCYMYQHADQTWKNQPLFLKDDHVILFSERLKDYVLEQKLKRVLIVFHGGEPLLITPEKIVEIVQRIRSIVGSTCEVDFGMQTNGVLLSKNALDIFLRHDITVSLSIDGPQHIHDQYRLDHKGRSHFDKTLSALKMLQSYPKINMGCIAVINPNYNPRELFEFFKSFNVPEISFLLPDANYQNLPVGRDKNKDLYVNWLIEAFDIWYKEFPEMSCKTFEMIIRGFFGETGLTDGLGLGEVTMLTIETDGSYHDLDVLKITDEGLDSLGDSLESCSFNEVASNSKLLHHQKLLTIEGLSSTCQSCELVSVCGGGSVPHRYDGSSFDNPTVYCQEMKSLIEHMKLVIFKDIQEDIDRKKQHETDSALDSIELTKFLSPSHANLFIDDLCERLGLIALTDLGNLIQNYQEKGKVPEDLCFDPSQVKFNASFFMKPSNYLWIKTHLKLSKNQVVRSLDGTSITEDLEYLSTILDGSHTPPSNSITYHQNNPWLRVPFSKEIQFENDGFGQDNKTHIDKSMAIIKDYDPDLFNEIHSISPEFQFIRDISAHPEKAVSFSDDAVPGALYICLWQHNELMDPYDLADSIIHEHLHQKLYLLQRLHPIIQADEPELYSPWRQCLRPVSGVFHAVFVFSELVHYWFYVSEKGPAKMRQMAFREVDVNCGRVLKAIEDLKTASLTVTGSNILTLLEDKTKACIQKLKSGKSLSVTNS